MPNADIVLISQIYPAQRNCVISSEFHKIHVFIVLGYGEQFRQNDFTESDFLEIVWEVNDACPPSVDVSVSG